MPDAQEFRDNAALCDRLAEVRPDEREHWLKLAALWNERAKYAPSQKPPTLSG